VPPPSPPVVEGDRLYTTGAGGLLVARSVSTGAEDWRVTFDGDVTAAAAVEGRVFAATTGRWLYALDARRGQVRWRYRLGGSAIGMLTDEDRVVLVMLDQSVRAFKMGSGAQAWRQPLSFRPVAGPVLAGGSLLVTGYGPAMRVMDRRTGANQGTYTLPLPPISIATATLAAGPIFHSGATIFDDVVLLVTQHGFLHAARRLAEPMAMPLTAMPVPGLPAPSPPPGWVPPAVEPKTEPAAESPAVAATPAATPATAPTAPPPPAPKPPR
jgi:hypothetical protein